MTAIPDLVQNRVIQIWCKNHPDLVQNLAFTDLQEDYTSRGESEACIIIDQLWEKAPVFKEKGPVTES